MMFAFKMPELSEDVKSSHASININLLLMLGSENGFILKFNSFTGTFSTD